MRRDLTFATHAKYRELRSIEPTLLDEVYKHSANRAGGRDLKHLNSTSAKHVTLREDPSPGRLVALRDLVNQQRVLIFAGTHTQYEHFVRYRGHEVRSRFPTLFFLFLKRRLPNQVILEELRN